MDPLWSKPITLEFIIREEGGFENIKKSVFPKESNITKTYIGLCVMQVSLSSNSIVKRKRDFPETVAEQKEGSGEGGREGREEEGRKGEESKDGERRVMTKREH